MSNLSLSLSIYYSRLLHISPLSSHFSHRSSHSHLAALFQTHLLFQFSHLNSNLQP
ncbi:hypothetical protein HanIR_Chr13g0628041 [Helianthus annuus]|nr:hypothetical protein HanIR_Chr13g0628041 [Helianthus annuus]